MRRPVTVIIPVKDRNEELLAALSSVLPQLGDLDEVLVIDDGSGKPLRFDGADKRVRILRNAKSKGPAGARNVGIANAKSDILAFLDSDDLWLPGKLDAQRAMMDDEQGLVAIVSGWRELIDGAPFRERIPKPARTGSDHFLGCWFCPGSTLLIRKEAFSVCGPYREDIRRLEDYEWFLRFAANGGRLRVLREYGAVINRGRNNEAGLVENAVATIRDQYKNWPGVTGGERRGMMAYLNLELAGAYRNEKKYTRMLSHIFTSLMYRPRLSLQLRNWWTPT